MSIKIISVDFFKLNIPMKFPFKISLGISEEANNVLVRINTNEGIYGFGEACSSPRITGDTQSSSIEAGIKIAKQIIGKDPLAISERMEEMDSLFLKKTQIKSAFNQALYDILGKRIKLPFKILTLLI